MKYCPKCLRECTVSPYGGYACQPCGVLQYCDGILFDTPDKEASKIFRLKEYLRKITHYEVSEDMLDDVINEIKEILYN